MDRKQNYIGLRIGRQTLTEEDQRSRQQIYESVCRLAESQKYHIEQRNGQRFFGPPIGYPFPAPDKDCEVFIGCIPRNVYEDQLVPMLNLAGTLYQFRLMMDFNGNNRGFGFALYETPQQAMDACRLLNKYEIVPGKYIACIPCNDNNTIYLGGVRNISAEEMAQTIYAGTSNAIRVQITYPDNRAMRYAVVRYTSHREAALARRFYMVANYQLWKTRAQVIVDWKNRHPLDLPFYLEAPRTDYGFSVQYFDGTQQNFVRAA